jgi:hypothetical protein
MRNSALPHIATFDFLNTIDALDTTIATSASNNLSIFFKQTIWVGSSHGQGVQ